MPYLIHEIANTGKKLKLKYVKMEEVFGGYKDITRRKLDLTKAKYLLGYEPRFSTRQAIERIIKSRKNIG